ncbi:hypothetical protein GDO86_010525 [Hymenochirus boettgeri]|uniref:Uncharacterized protein n=1 Tax=Hymenochirus boettgeri TaxID=247094 RepID=A0A8T2JKU4_9PIPI|nr:hypothetical protein GDO86_010525 [Hymenochirus boettgeri]
MNIACPKFLYFPVYFALEVCCKINFPAVTRRQNEWVDITRFILSKADENDENEAADSPDQEMEDTTEPTNGNSAQGQKRKLDEPEPDTKKPKVEVQEAAPNKLLGPGSDFAEELTCGLCVELFKDPVMVECGHNFCKSCIEKAWGGKDSFSCPECKEVIEKRYTINRALANLVKKTVGTAPVVPVEKKEKPLENCPEHDERLKLYCKDDGTLGCIICRDSLKHASHNFLPILDAVAVYRVSLHRVQPWMCLEQQQEVVSTSGNTLLSKELCQGTFKGPIQYIVWKEMKNTIVPTLSPMMLDPSTAHPNLILADGLTSVKYGDAKLTVPDNPKRFSQCILVLGAEGFDSGRHYWEVEVGDKTAWDVGMASESSNRKGKIKLNPKNGYWAIWLRNGNAYKALESPSKTLVLSSKPRKIGVYVDYEGGMISFYNGDDMTPIYTFNATFTEKLYPYLSPFLHDSGRNAEPLRLLHN